MTPSQVGAYLYPMSTSPATPAQFSQAANEAYPLRVVRGTTGTIHAAREYQREVLDFNAPTVAERRTGRYETIVAKACGADSHTLRRVSGVGGTDAQARVTCAKCVKHLNQF